MGKSLGVLLMTVGVILLVVGVLAYLGALNWLGRLPGDVRIDTENTRVYFPLTTMILLSVVLSLGLYLVRRFF
jgi:uncharacterized protein HemY